jgi:hypothetical protein
MPIKISKPGYDVKTAAAKNLIFDSTANHLKTRTSGIITRTVSAYTIDTGTVYHNLGYVPLGMAFFNQSSGGETFICFNMQTPSRAGTEINVILSVNTTQINFKCQNYSDLNRTVYIYYELFYEGM